MEKRGKGVDYHKVTWRSGIQNRNKLFNYLPPFFYAFQCVNTDPIFFIACRNNEFGERSLKNIFSDRADAIQEGTYVPVLP